MVPEIPEEVRELKERIARFVREEIHPFEAEIAERGEIDEEKLSALRAKARAAGFSNLNMPREYGGMDLSVASQVALEEEAGDTNNPPGVLGVGTGPVPNPGPTKNRLTSFACNKKYDYFCF